MEVVAPPHVLAIGSLVPVSKSSPERRNQKEIVAGEERPKFLTTPTKTEDSQGEFTNGCDFFCHSLYLFILYFLLFCVLMKLNKFKKQTFCFIIIEMRCAHEYHGCLNNLYKSLLFFIYERDSILEQFLLKKKQNVKKAGGSRKKRKANKSDSFAHSLRSYSAQVFHSLLCISSVYFFVPTFASFLYYLLFFFSSVSYHSISCYNLNRFVSHFHCCCYLNDIHPFSNQPPV